MSDNDDWSGENTGLLTELAGRFGEELAPGGDTITDRLHSFLGRPGIENAQSLELRENVFMLIHK